MAEGRSMRTVTLHLPSRDGPAVVVYSTPTDALDGVLARLAVVLSACGLAAGAAAALVAVAVARAALRPLRATADVVGAIDEQKLNRRIDEASLPTEMRPVAARLNEMFERLERAFADRRRFLADASHELRTPVAALVTTLEVALRRKRDAAELTRTLENCLTDARYLRRLVIALLELARGETTASQPAADPFDAAAVLDQCCNVADALAGPAGVKVVKAYAGPMAVVSDADRLRGVVTNLLANAVEHSPAGAAVELAAGLAGGTLEVSVRDAGPGIPAHHLPHLFQPFYRADASRRRGDVPHLGLGLYLVEAHVRALGGSCEVSSDVGVGTTMRVILPGVAAPPGGVSTKPITPTPAQSPAPRPSPGTNISPAPAVLQAGGSRR
jgi:signal transduction histidine kinase